MKNSPRTLLSPPPNIQTRDRHMGKDIHPFSRSGHTTDGDGWRGAFHKRARSAIRSRPTENILRPLMLLARSTEARTSSLHTSCSSSLLLFPTQQTHILGCRHLVVVTGYHPTTAAASNRPRNHLHVSRPSANSADPALSFLILQIDRPAYLATFYLVW